MNEALTSDYDQGCEAGEGGDVELHAMEGLRKLQDGVNPVPKAADTLHFVKHGPIAEDELVHFRIGTSKEKASRALHVNDKHDEIHLCSISFCWKLHSPICKTQDEELNKRRLQQQFLIFWAELRETWDALRPLPDDLHGGCE